MSLAESDVGPLCSIFSFLFMHFSLARQESDKETEFDFWEHDRFRVVLEQIRAQEGVDQVLHSFAFR